jgi:pantoate--beta-alanine ligase
MKTVETLSELGSARAQLTEPVGLVPTMGYLHEGHLSLVRLARQENASVVVSVFVNPTQFGPSEDLDAYPRDLQRDLVLLQEEGTDLVWTPAPEHLYPPGFQTWVTVEAASKPLEGAHRPGHFRGVATVVAKLFNAIQPQRAYFGQKDAQQTVVIRQMVRDLNFPTAIVIGPTVREPDGLALSSRNAYLTPEQRRAATVLFRALRVARQAFMAGQQDATTLRQIMAETIDGEPLARRQYVSCADPETLLELEGPVDRALLSMAVFVGTTRLIDNMLVHHTCTCAAPSTSLRSPSEA